MQPEDDIAAVAVGWDGKGLASTGGCQHLVSIALQYDLANFHAKRRANTTTLADMAVTVAQEE